MIFKCLFCQNLIKDGELICVSNCEHFIHEYCIEQMKSLNDHTCKNCNDVTIVDTVFKDFDKSKQTTIDGITVIIDKLDKLIEIIKSREDELADLTKKQDEVSDRLEGLLIEHHAVKFEKNEMAKRLKKLEDAFDKKNHS